MLSRLLAHGLIPWLGAMGPSARLLAHGRILWFGAMGSSARLLARGLILWLAATGSSALAAGSARDGAAFALAPQRPGVTDVYVLSFGLWGPQSVFESEAKGAAQVLAARLDAQGRSIVRFNGKRRFDALPQDLVAAADAVGRVLDPEEDVAVLVLTSHGGPDGVGLVAGRTKRLLSPAVAGMLLDRTRARYRVLIVSACYSGVFAKALADPRTLVITAAASDRPSFGCQDGARWTYFGDAFFNQALRTEPSLPAAFARARALVGERERREGFDPSEPQIAGGTEVLARLGERMGSMQATRPPAGAEPCGAARPDRPASCPPPAAVTPH